MPYCSTVELNGTALPPVPTYAKCKDSLWLAQIYCEAPDLSRREIVEGHPEASIPEGPVNISPVGHYAVHGLCREHRPRFRPAR